MIQEDETENSRSGQQPPSPALQPYLEALQQEGVTVPVPDRPHLLQLAQWAERMARAEPGQAWRLMSLVDSAAQRGEDALVRALAAWHRARAANTWCRPALAVDLLERAEQEFATLERAEGWLAACRWQRNAVPWMQDNLERCVSELLAAETGMVAAGPAFAAMLAECRLTLAYAHTLAGEFDAAEQKVAQAQTYFSEQKDTLFLARCRYTLAAVLRRQSHIEQAQDELDAALEVFETRSPLDEALARCQTGFLLLLGAADYGAAEATFAQALRAFEVLDLPPWQAVCHGGLAQAQIMTGRLAQAAAALQRALELFKIVDVPGQQAATLLDIGWLESQRGDYARSLEALQKAEQITRRVGNRWLHAASVMHLGETNLRLGRYQQALQHLEEAARRFEALNSPLRVAECQLRLADAWTQLGRARQALRFLEKAAQQARQAGQVNILPYASYRRANGYFQLDQPDRALEALEEALVLAHEQKDRPGVALAQRLLGEALSATGHSERALAHLDEAQGAFEEMGMVMEQAACQVALGYYHQREGAAAAAQTAWENALGQSQALMPDVEWQARAGLARLAQADGDEAAALAAYDQAIGALRRLRAGLWQPALAGSYLRRWEPTLERAVALAATTNRAHKALAYIEEGKAQLMARHLGAGWSHDWAGPARGEGTLATLRAEIGWLQDQLRASFGQARNLAQQQQRLGELARKVQAYETALEQQERQALANPLPVHGEGFRLEQFRALAQEKLAEDWLALDYFRADKRLYGVMLNAETCTVWEVGGNRLNLALRGLLHPPPEGQDLDERDLARVGERLLPEAVQERLAPETRLIIAPHADLHGVPWAALTLAKDSPLVARCIPLIVPSLHALSRLWQRADGSATMNGPGLLLALSTFANEQPPLPEVTREAELLQPLLGPAGEPLRDEEATWERLQALRAQDGWRRFSFLHLASHAFHDGVSGRLSGFALYDRDVYLDDLWQLAPLPPLVTLSACSGSKSMVLGGDEHVGLPTTCLAAGAQHVVGSLWPIPDAGPAHLMAAFYRALQTTSSPAAALATAQRQLAQRGEAAVVWGAFRCIGSG